jgi:hypothetical protein
MDRDPWAQARPARYRVLTQGQEDISAGTRSGSKLGNVVRGALLANDGGNE